MTAGAALLLIAVFSGAPFFYIDSIKISKVTTSPPEGGAVLATNSHNSQVVIRIPTDPAPSPLDERVASAVFTLLPMQDKGEQSINLGSRQPRTVQLDLVKADGSPEYQSYSATLKTANGGVVSAFPKLKSMHLQIPTRKLANGNYVLFLDGVKQDGSPEPVSRYAFSVHR